MFKKASFGIFLWLTSIAVLASPVGLGAYSTIRSNISIHAGGGVVAVNGGTGFSSSSASYSPSDSYLGTGEASTVFLSDGTPQLKVKATSWAGVESSTQAVQRYRYTGNSAITLNMNASFHAIMDVLPSDDGGFLGDPPTTFTGTAALWNATSQIENFLDIGYGSGLGSFSDGIISQSDVPRYMYFPRGGYNQVFFSLSADLNNTNFTDHVLQSHVTLSLSPGEEFFLYGSMSAQAENGATVNALNTGTFSFDYAASGITSSDLVPLGNLSSVPLPAAFWLFASGFFGLVGFSRSMKS